MRQRTGQQPSPPPVGRAQAIEQRHAGNGARGGDPRPGRRSAKRWAEAARRAGQGFGGVAERRRAIEQRGMEAARAYFEARGYALEDTHADRPYDFHATRGGDDLFIEVKGTGARGETVILTRREVEHARDNRGRVVLFVLSAVEVEARATGPAAAGARPYRPVGTQASQVHA